MKSFLLLTIILVIACGERASEPRSVSGSATATLRDAPSSLPADRASNTPGAAPVSSTGQPLRVSGDSVTEPVAIKRVEIDFKPCLDMKIDIGLPIIDAVIDKSGVPQNVRLLKPLHPCVEKQVLTAVKQS